MSRVVLKGMVAIETVFTIFLCYIVFIAQVNSLAVFLMIAMCTLTWVLIGTMYSESKKQLARRELKEMLKHE